MKSTLPWVLRLPEGANESPLLYGAEILANSWAGDVVVEQAGEGEIGLATPNGSLVSLEELRAVFQLVTFYGESAEGADYDAGSAEEGPVSGTPAAGPAVEYFRARLRGPSNDSSGSGANQLTVLLTHDIDRLTCREPTFLARYLLGRLGVIERPWLGDQNSLKPGFLRKGLERLLQFELDHGIGGMYFFLASGYDLGRHGARYSLRWPVARTALRLVRDAAMGIGLHGSYDACTRGSYGEERHRLEDAAGVEVRAHRNHYLRFDPGVFWHLLEGAGIAYDFSVGFRSQMGFSAGLATPYLGYDGISKRPSSVWEIPLVFMDQPHYLGDVDATLHQLRGVLMEARRFGGCVSINFHPENLVLQPGMWDLFTRTVELCRELDCDISGQLPERTDLNTRPVGNSQ